MDPRRRERQLKLRIALAAALLLSGCVSPSPEVVASAELGRSDARADIARRRPRIAFIGLLQDDASALDPESGLTKFSVGCCKSYERISYCDSYNAVIEDARHSGELESMSLARKATTRSAVEARFAAGGSVEIHLGGPAATAPGGRFTIAVAPGAGRDAVAIWSTDATSGERTELRYVGGDTVRVTFTDEGSTLLVRDDGARLYATFDLPGALPLQVFPDAPRW